MRRDRIAGRVLLLVLAATGASAAAGAQAPTGDPLPATRACPSSTGIEIGTTSGDSATRAAPPARRLALDTTWRFDIADRRWTRPWWAGFITAGVIGGTSGAPSRQPDARALSVCAGVAVHLQQPTLVLRGARGTVRLRADLSDIARRAPAGGAGRDTTPRP